MCLTCLCMYSYVFIYLHTDKAGNCGHRYVVCNLQCGTFLSQQLGSDKYTVWTCTRCTYIIHVYLWEVINKCYIMPGGYIVGNIFSSLLMCKSACVPIYWKCCKHQDMQYAAHILIIIMLSLPVQCLLQGILLLALLPNTLYLKHVLQAGYCIL